MRLYHLEGATSVSHGSTTYKAAADGGFDFPPGLYEHMHGMAVNGVRQWETAIERQQREVAAELARMRDPATLYEAVAKIVSAAEGKPDAPAKTKPAAASK